MLRFEPTDWTTLTFFFLIQKQLISAPTASPLVPEPLQTSRVAVAEGLPSSAPSGGPTNAGSGGVGASPSMSSEEADLQRRLDALRRD